MSLTCAHTAVLLFARNPADEARAKSWFGAARERQNITVASRLLRSVKTIAAHTGLTVVTITSDNQIGHSFGERLQHAFSKVFSMGFSKVIGIGSDTPNLRSGHIRTASRALMTSGMVLGPDYRGGVYLIGLDRDTFQQIEFDAIPWQTEQVVDALRSCRPNEEILLGYLHDLNTFEDLVKVIRNATLPTSMQSLLSRLLSVWKQQVSLFRSIVCLLSKQKALHLIHRGPPLQVV